MRMVAEIRAEEDSEWAAMTRVSQLLGVGAPETVRKWVRRANAILRSASVFFAAELDRPQR